MSHQTVENFGIIDQLVGGDDGHLNIHMTQSKTSIINFFLSILLFIFVVS